MADEVAAAEAFAAALPPQAPRQASSSASMVVGGSGQRGTAGGGRQVTAATPFAIAVEIAEDHARSRAGSPRFRFVARDEFAAARRAKRQSRCARHAFFFRFVRARALCDRRW